MLFDDYPQVREHEEEEEQEDLDLLERLFYGVVVPNGMFLAFLIGGMLLPPIYIIFYLLAEFLRCADAPFAPFAFAPFMQGVLVLFVKRDKSILLKWGTLAYLFSFIAFAIIYPLV